MAGTIHVIKYWGNSLGVRIPAVAARDAGLSAEQPVEITVEGGRVVITPLENPAPTLEQRLERFDPQRHGGEVMGAELIGKESW
jgi:antitoxin MazE